MTDIKKILDTQDSTVMLTRKEAGEIRAYIEEKEELAALGEEYKKSIIKELVSLCAKAMPQMDLKVFSGVAAVMTTKELLSFKAAFQKQQAAENMPAPQLLVAKGKAKDSFNEFRI